MPPARKWSSGSAAHADAADVMPPNSREAERALLGSMLRDNGIIPEVLELVKSDDFYNYAHEQIFKAICELYLACGGADIVTVAEELTHRNRMADIGSVTYLVELFECAPCTNHKEYARIILRKAERRGLIADGLERVRRAYDEGDDLADLIPSLGGARLATTC